MKKMLLAMIIISLGCREKSSEVLFKAGTAVTYYSDYKTKYGDSLIDRTRLDEMVQKKLFALEGKALGMEKDSAVILGLETFEKSLLLDFLYDEVVTKKAKATPGEIKDVYDKLKDQYELAQIVVETDAVAKEVWAQIADSVPFETLAVKYSTDENSKMYGGRIGVLPVQALDPEIHRRIKDLPAGGITRPFPHQNKYYLVRMIEHKTVDLPPFDQIQDQLAQRLETERKNKLAREFIDWIFERAAIEYNPEGLEVIAKDDSLLAPGALDEWVVKKYKTKVVRVSTLRPAVKRLYDLYGFDPKILVQRELQTDLLYDEAVRRNLNRKPDYVAKVQDGLGELLSQKFYDQQILARVTVDTMEMEQYYQDHKPELKKPYKDAVGEIWTILYEQNIKKVQDEVTAALAGKYPIEINQPVVEKYLKESK